MGLPLPEDLCSELEIDISVFLDLSIDLPGGVSLRAQLPAGTFPNLPDIVGSIMGQMNAALTPLMPIFRILDVVIALVEFSKAIPDALGPPPDPTSVIKKLKKLLKAFAHLAALFPPLSIPVMIVTACKVVVAALTALVDQIEHSLTVQASLDLARGKAGTLALDPLLLEGAAALELSIDCAQANLDLQLSVGMSGMGPLNKILDLLSLFMGLIGLPEFLKIDVGTDPSAMLAPLRAGIEALNIVCGSIPV